MKKVSLGIIILIGLISTFSFKSIDFNDKDCKDLLGKVLTKMKFRSGKPMKIGYSILVRYRDGEKNSSYNADVSMATFGSKTSFISNGIEVYTDGITLVTVNKDDKIIILSNATRNETLKFRADVFSLFVDSLLSKAQIFSCDAPASDGIKKVLLGLPEPLSNSLGIKSLEYWIDEKKMDPKKCVVLYQWHPQGINEVELTIQDIEWNYQEEPFKGPSLSKVMNKNHELIGTYKNYGIRDLR